MGEYASPPIDDATYALGDMEARKRLRAKLQCKSFAWFLQHAAPNMYVPDITGLKAGALANMDVEDACFDTLGGNSPGLYPCHWQHGTQGLVLDGSGLVRIPLLMYQQCAGVSVDGSKVFLDSCPNSASERGGR